MGLLDRLFNRKKPSDDRAHAAGRPDRLPPDPPRAGETPAPVSRSSGTSSPAASSAPSGGAERPIARPVTDRTTGAGEEPAPRGDVLETAAKTSASSENSAPAAPIAAAQPAGDQTAVLEPSAGGETAALEQLERTPPEGSPAQGASAGETSAGIAAFDPVLQKQLNAYFARLRAVYPDGVITRLNTGHKKLAERGAALRKRTGQEGDLDAFFALGGFTYRRSAGGRPPLPLSDDLSAIVQKLKAYFPDGIPAVMAIRDTDHRLYLDLRALARRENRTVGEFLQAHGLR